MGLQGKLIAAIELKLVEMCSTNYSGTSQSIFPQLALKKYKVVIFMRVNLVMLVQSFVEDGKEKKAKQVIQAIDEEKKLIEFQMLERDLMELYKNFLITIHVETSGDIDLVTWTLEYEMLNEDVEHPISLLSFFINLTKDIETYHLN